MSQSPNTSNQFFPDEPAQGIEASLKIRESVVSLYVSAREAEEYFFWPMSSAHKLKEQFPRLRKVTIQDDYLSQKQIDSLSQHLQPVVVEWTYGLFIDGRHGK